MSMTSSKASATTLSLSASKARAFGIVKDDLDDPHFFTTWQALCCRLDAIDTNWQVHFSEPVAVSDYITMQCRLMIRGVTREATGSDKGCLIHVGDSNIGIYAPEQAMINAFRNAAMQFGVMIPFWQDRSKKPPDSNHDLESVVTILRKMQRKQNANKSFARLRALVSLMRR